MYHSKPDSRTQAKVTLILAWENSRHLATLPLVSPPNDVWETNVGIPYWRRVTTDLGSASDWSCRVGNLIQPIRKHFPDLGSDASSVSISALVSQASFGGEISCCIAKCRLFSQATLIPTKEMKERGKGRIECACAPFALKFMLQSLLTIS